MKADGVARVMAGLGIVLSGCSLALNFGPEVLLPALDAGPRDGSPSDAPGDGADRATSDADASPDCGATTCACAPGTGDCDGVATNGCETDLTTSDAHCGACQAACVGLMRCSASACRGESCRAPEVVCGMQCVDLRGDVRHCGACGASCGPGAPRCCNGACAMRCQ